MHLLSITRTWSACFELASADLASPLLHELPSKNPVEGKEEWSLKLGSVWRQEEVRKHFEKELAAHESGMYRQSPSHFLANSWQGDALQVNFSQLTAMVSKVIL